MNSKAVVPAETSVGRHGYRSFTWNDDVLMEILLWLPAKSVIRFKLVCKSWLSLFSSDKFCHLHTLRRPKLQHSVILETSTSRFFYFNPITDAEKSMIPYSFPVPGPNIVSACNGLMLLQSHLKDKSFHVYNPSTRQSREIILPDTHSGDECIIKALTLAFDPSKSPHYHVVCIRLISIVLTDDGDQTCTYQLDAYDSENHTWKLCLGPTMLLLEPRILQGMYLNGLIYWRTLFEYCYYDIAKNEFKTFSTSIQDIDAFCHLQVSNGHLYLYQLFNEDESQSIKFFELDVDDPSSGVLKYHDVISQSAPGARPLRGIETFGLIYHVAGKISLYNFLDKSNKELFDFTRVPSYVENFDIKSYEFGECLAMV